jgi:thiol-disulfide isomerase/thioredoxin
MSVSIRYFLIAMLSAAVTAGCGPLPAGTPPASAPARSSAARRVDELGPTAEGPLGSIPLAAAHSVALPPITLGDDYEAGLARAEAEGKPLLLFFTAPWCEYSRRLEAEVLCQADAQAAASRFVCVRIDVGRRDLHEQYRVKVFPTIIPATSRGTASQRLTGAQTVESFVTGLTTALTAVTEPRPAAETAIQR